MQGALSFASCMQYFGMHNNSAPPALGIWEGEAAWLAVDREVTQTKCNDALSCDSGALDAIPPLSGSISGQELLDALVESARQHLVRAHVLLEDRC